MRISTFEFISLIILAALAGSLLTLAAKPALVKIKQLIDLDKKLIRFANWLEERGIIVGQTISTIVIAFGLFFFSDFAIELIDKTSPYFKPLRFLVFGVTVAAAFAQIVLAYAQAKYTKRLSNIEKEKEKYRVAYEESISDFEATCKGMNVNLAEELGSPKGGHSDRITIYSKDVKHFVPVGRYSRNPVHSEKGDELFKLDFGCIAEAWTNGDHFDNTLPDPITNLSDYQTAQEMYGLRRNQSKRMKMKSRLYFGWRVLNNVGDKPIAVIIVESTDPDRWTKKYLLSFFEAKKVTLRPTIERVSKYAGKPSIATEEEY